MGQSSVKQPSIITSFLGTEHWKQLFSALRDESKIDQLPLVGSTAIIAALLVGFVPLGCSALPEMMRETDLDLATIGFGISAILSLFIRSRLGIDHRPTKDWRSAMRITHTAFALGCVPAVVILALYPEMFANRHDILNQAVGIQRGSEAQFLWFLRFALGVIGITAWVAVTEEYIFRGLLFAVLRRWKLFNSQAKRDVFAAVVSSLLFGAAHYPTWGAPASIALAGLGFGFVIGYIANGERIMPIIFYHFLFDTAGILLTLAI